MGGAVALTYQCLLPYNCFTRKGIQVKLISCFAVLCCFSNIAFGVQYPSEADMAGIKSVCGAGKVDSLSVLGNVDAAIRNWKNAAAGATLQVAKQDLAAALGQIKNDANLAPNYKIYVDCVQTLIQAFLTRTSITDAAEPSAKWLQKVEHNEWHGAQQFINDVCKPRDLSGVIIELRPTGVKNDYDFLVKCRNDEANDGSTFVVNGENAQGGETDIEFRSRIGGKLNRTIKVAATPYISVDGRVRAYMYVYQQ